MIDTTKLLTILIEGGAFISALAAIVAALIMSQVNKKFGTGVLASGFKSIAVGVFFIALGILADAIQSYVQAADLSQLQQWVTYIELGKLGFIRNRDLYHSYRK